jgi:hypothetical protein
MENIQRPVTPPQERAESPEWADLTHITRDQRLQVFAATPRFHACPLPGSH